MHSAHYRVAGIREIKCWTVLDFEGGGSISFRRTLTDRDLISQIEGKRVKVSSARLPPIQASDVEYISYHGQRVYPFREKQRYA